MKLTTTHYLLTLSMTFSAHAANFQSFKNFFLRNNPSCKTLQSETQQTRLCLESTAQSSPLSTKNFQQTPTNTPSQVNVPENTLPTTKNDNSSQLNSSPKTNHPLQAAKLHRYFMASYYQSGNKIEKSHTWYNRLVHDGMPPYAYPGYIRFLHTLGQSKHIYTLMPTVDALLPNDPDIQLIFAQVLEQAGKEQESQNRVIKLSQTFPLNEEICYAAAQIFIKRNEPAQAISTIDALINTAPRKQNTFIFHYSKAIAHLALDSKQQALVSVKKSIELQPQFDRGWLLYSLIEEQLGNTQEALRGYAMYLNIAGKKGLIELHVQRLKNKKMTIDPELKSEQQAIFDIALHKHATNERPRYLKELLTRFAQLDSSSRFQP